MSRPTIGDRMGLSALDSTESVGAWQSLRGNTRGRCPSHFPAVAGDGLVRVLCAGWPTHGLPGRHLAGCAPAALRRAPRLVALRFSTTRSLFQGPCGIARGNPPRRTLEVTE